MTSEKVLYDKRREVAWITLNRPEVHNAIDTDVNDRLREIWEDFRADDALRVAVLTGAGDKAFCAGADLKTHVPAWLANTGPSLAYSMLENGFGGGITRGLHRIYKPVIAALNGWTVGFGVELAMACDVRIAAEHVQIGSFELRRGMHPADGGIVRLVNACGVGIAMEMELTGEPISAQRALQVNMVNQVVPAEELYPAVEAFVAKILRNPRRGVESAKQTILEVVGRPLDDQLRLECLIGYSIMDDPEINERREHFLAHGD
jgi:enoyl-CoA hydratase/carnithine racemase